MTSTTSELETLLERVLDPTFDIVEDNFHYVDVAQALYERGPDTELADSVIQMILLRLYCRSKWVFAITIGQFPDYDGIEAYWISNGFRDINGFRWLVDLRPPV